MAEPEKQRGNLYTLSEISKRTGISMPTLQRYKKMYQSRIPSEGQGRKQRYPEDALPVFNEIKVENAGRRGRPRKSEAGAGGARPAAKRRGRPPGAGKKAASRRKTGARRGRPPGAAKKAARRGRPRKQASGGGGLLTLTEISKRTGISYPTLVRYVRLYSEKLPSEGLGRARRFYSQAVDVFRQLRSESPRGGRRKRGGGAKRAAAANGRRRGGRRGGEGAVAKRLKQIEKTQQSLAKRLEGLVNRLQKVFR
jgi:predicted DNA-binding transcriptional regulator AlpA